MKQGMILCLAALFLALLGYDSARGGSREGKIRWSAKKTGACKWFPPIVVPKANLEEKKPGIHALKLTFKGNELAEFFVMGDGDTDLDLFIRDSKGKIIAKDEDPAERGSDLCVCRWMPEEDEEFTIIIVNNGKIENVATCGCN